MTNPPTGHWFEEHAEHLGAAYDRYAHTKGTSQEIDHLVGALGLRPGERILDVGCGTGRHALELARRGFHVHGVDISQRFVDIATQRASDERNADIRAVRSSPDESPSGSATFARADARTMVFVGEFDAVISLCQGAFGMMTEAGDDAAVVAGMAQALRPGGRLALSAFNAYFVVRYHHDATFDADTGVARETTRIHNEAGEVREVDLWTGCCTPRELRLLLGMHGFVVDSISSVEPGAYGTEAPTIESPELLTIAHLGDRRC